jgi:hypothetical protein
MKEMLRDSLLDRQMKVTQFLTQKRRITQIMLDKLEFDRDPLPHHVRNDSHIDKFLKEKTNLILRAKNLKANRK